MAPQQITNLPHLDPSIAPLVREAVDAFKATTVAVQGVPDRFDAKLKERGETLVMQLCGGLLVVGLILIAFFKRQAK